MLRHNKCKNDHVTNYHYHPHCKWKMKLFGRRDEKRCMSKVMIILLSSYLTEMFKTTNGINTLQITLHSTSILQQWKEECYFLRYDNPKFLWRIVHWSLLCIHKMVWSAHSMSLQLFILNHTNTWSRVFENRIKWNSVQNNFWHDVIC